MNIRSLVVWAVGPLLLVACASVSSDAGATPAVEIPAVAAGVTFTNPIVPAAHPGGSADPSVVFHNGYYFYCRSVGNRSIGVAKARRLQDIGSAPMSIVWSAVPGTAYSDEVWAPELQYLRGKWYIYFAASDGHNINHRMYAIEARSDDPEAGYDFKGRVSGPEDAWAIDGIVIENAGALYFVWAGLRTENQPFPQVLYIAGMSDPTTISGPRHEIAGPDRVWEQVGAPLLEAPAALRHGDVLHVAYSASGSWTDDYAIGLLTYMGGDILAAASWVKTARPVFAKAPAAGVFGPGHNSFVLSPDGSEQWIVYHGIDHRGGGWEDRSVRAQRFRWAANGALELGVPVTPGTPVEEPSGTVSLSL